MQAAMQASAAPISNRRSWAGRVISAIPVLFLTFDATIHIVKIQPVVDSFKQLGYPIETAVPIGIIELVCLALYVFPQTAVLGAILWTGYLGGAVASQVRIGAPLFGFALFPVYVAVLLWVGLYLREPRLKNLLPFRT